MVAHLSGTNFRFTGRPRTSADALPRGLNGGGGLARGKSGCTTRIGAALRASASAATAAVAVQGVPGIASKFRTKEKFMRPAAVVAVVVLASFAGAQTPANQNQKPPQPGTASTPPAKHLPQAKTQPEFDAYKAAVANQNDPATMEKAADDFAAKFPNSE